MPTVLVLTALLALPLSGCATGDTAAEDRHDTYAGPISVIVIEADDQGGGQLGSTTARISITVTTADRADVELDRTLEHTDGDAPEEDISQRGGTLNVALACPQRTFAIGFPTCVGDYRVEAPAGTEISVRTHNGDISIQLDSARPWNVQAASAHGQTVIDVPQDPAGVLVEAQSENGDVTVGAR